MNIKIKSTVFLTILASFVLSANAMAAQSVEITGQAFGDNVGLIHFDPNTAKNQYPADPGTLAPQYYVGPTKQFRMNRYDPFFTPAQPYFPYNSAVKARISTAAADCDINPGTVDDGCILNGFAWSDTLGWIAVDGPVIQQAIINAGGIAADYPEKYWPRVKASNAGNPNRVALTGMAWNEFTGWINLSSDTSGTTGVVTDDSLQDQGNFGVYLEITQEVRRVVVDPGPPAITEKLGRIIGGFAWSERLGWIKFSKSPADTIDFESFTLWVPDRTPPIPLAANNAWFVPGVNTGYPAILNTNDPIQNNVPQNVIWEDFAIDPESGINTKDTQIHLIADDPANCTVTLSGYLTNPLPPKYNTLGVGDTFLPYFANLGNVKTAPNGFCKYELHAQIWNDVNQVIYHGNFYPPDATAAAEARTFPAITVYVRAGDPSEQLSFITATPTNPDTIVADGSDHVNYTVDLLDVAGNPVIDLTCGEYAGCPGRETDMSANILNELIFDLTQPNKVQPARPVKYGDYHTSATATLFSESDSGYLGSNVWKVDVDRVPTKRYQLEMTSFAPSGIFFLASQGQPMTNPKRLYTNSFNYEVHNDKLPNFSEAVDTLIPNYTLGQPWYTLKTDTDKEVAECYDDDNAATVPSCANPTFPTTNPGPRWQTLVHAQFEDPVQKNITFLPAIFTESGLVNGELAPVLSTTSPVDVSFDVSNRSDRDLTASTDGFIAFDNIFQFYGASGSAAAIEIASVANDSAGDPNDNKLGWTDPNEYCPDCKRFEMYMDGGDHHPITSQGNYTPLTSQFTGSYSDNPFHPGEKFFFNFNILSPVPPITLSYPNMLATAPAGFPSNISPLPNATDEISVDGVYYPSGIAEIPQTLGPIVTEENGGDLTDPFNYDIGEIDRLDKSNLDLNNNSSVGKKISFLINKIGKGNLKSFNFRLAHEVAYRFPDQEIPTVYATETPVINDVEVQDVGLQATGTVAAEQIVTGRQFDVIGTVSTRKLQEQVRRNVAELLAGSDPGANCPVPPIALTAFDTNTSNTDCVFEDSVNGTLVRVYEGDENQTLILGDGVTDLTAPDKPYTIILQGGANLFIKNNIVYNPANPNSSLGLIVIAGEYDKALVGLQANVYLSPKPTNISAVLYTEGSLLSLAENYASGSTNNFVYFGGGGADIKDLSNQLYWRGSIASRNTIAGATQEKYPVGITCLSGDRTFSCSQRYDLDYLRRFTIVTDIPSDTSFVANNGLFSGGGSCDATGDCTCAGDCNTTLPSLVELIQPNARNIVDEANSELSAVFVEIDSLSLNNPPPGFTISTGLESTQEIR